MRDELPDEIGIVTKAALKNVVANDIVARTGDNFVYRPGQSALVLFDYDIKGMPQPMAQSSKSPAASGRR